MTRRHCVLAVSVLAFACGGESPSQPTPAASTPSIPPRVSANVSWFDAITDELMASFAARGVDSRSAAILSRAERDASPLVCNGEAFINPGSLQNRVTLG